jgi:hypothetical protein
MGCFEGSGVPILYIVRTVPKIGKKIVIEVYSRWPTNMLDVCGRMYAKLNECITRHTRPTYSSAIYYKGHALA